MAVREKDQAINGLRELIGDPEQLDRELLDFKKQAKLFSSRRAHFLQRYPKQWIAVQDGEVKAAGRTLASVLRQIDEAGLPREHTIVRYIDKNVRTFIL